MKKISYIIWASALFLGAVSCNREVIEVVSGPVTITASIADETKATLNESNGKFAFSDGDEIKVFDGDNAYTSTSVIVDGPVATFTMPSGFNNTNGAGLAAFPAGIVTAISGTSVTYDLPTTYTYAQVGGTNPNTAKVPCPMIATFTGGQELSFKQAGAVVRFQVKECLAGTLTFTFTTKVTGSVTLSAVPSGDNDGILAGNLSSAGYSITVTGVPAVSGDEVFYITLPVPTGTDPMNVGVVNHQALDEKLNRVARLAKKSPTDPNSLARAGGYKRGVNLVNVMSGVKFNNLFLDGYLYYSGGSYSVKADPLWILNQYRVGSGNTAYFNWTHLSGAGFCVSGSDGVTIGEKKYRLPTGGPEGEWEGIMGTTRTAAIINGEQVHYAYVTVTGLEYDSPKKESNKGLILFPDNAIIAFPSGATLSVFDAPSTANTITVDQHDYLLYQGCVFFPTAGYYYSAWGNANEYGFYWSATEKDAGDSYALAIDCYSSTYSLSPSAYGGKGDYYPARLIRVN